MVRCRMYLYTSAAAVVSAAPGFAQQVAVPNATPTVAQQSNLEPSDDIIVTARRRSETLQDVPQTVNVVTSTELGKLNLRNFTEIQNVVPGLQLQSVSAFNNTATVRGVDFSPVASGNNATVEFYLNDAPISSSFLFQSNFDFGQFELLRGPQGTLRGRASPSGSITVTTRRPDLRQAGVAFDGTVSTLAAHKVDGAINVPIITNVLGIRLAGVIDDNRGTFTRSLVEQGNDGLVLKPYAHTKAIRGSLRFDPTDWISGNFMVQNLHAGLHSFPQVESDSLVNPAAATPTTQIIGQFDRSSIDEPGSYTTTNQRIYVGNLDVRFTGQKLSYVGSYNKQEYNIATSQDLGNFFNPARGFAIAARPATDPAGFDQVCTTAVNSRGVNLLSSAYGQCSHTIGTRQSHELRLASETRVAGVFDYVVGGLYDHNNNPTNLTQETPVVLSLATPRLLTVVRTPVLNRGRSTEKAVFGNLTAHFLDDKLELSGGLRHINYQNRGALYQGSSTGTLPCPDYPAASTLCVQSSSTSVDQNATIYLASAKYQITHDLTVYALTGSSWRPGPRPIGNFSLGPNRQGQTAREIAFQNLEPETSRSYEIGMKATFFNRRAHINLSAYHQTFKNYPLVGPLVYFISTNSAGVETVGTANLPNAFGFLSPVPVTVNGVEGEVSFQLQKRWTIGLNASYADGRIRDATVACTDLNGDGVPDINPSVPTVAQLHAAVGAGQTLSLCNGVSRRSTGAPKFSANLQSEYGIAINRRAEGFLRGLYSFFGKTVNDPSNPLDDVKAYGLLNLYAGIRAPNGAWEISLFGKNIAQTERVLTTGQSPASTSVQAGATGTTFISQYRTITTTVPREFGLNVRFAFGSR